MLTAVSLKPKSGADISWAQFGWNMVSVYLGNVIGGAVFVGAVYFYAYRGKLGLKA